VQCVSNLSIAKPKNQLRKHLRLPRRECIGIDIKSTSPIWSASATRKSDKLDEGLIDVQEVSDKNAGRFCRSSEYRRRD